MSADSSEGLAKFSSMELGIRTLFVQQLPVLPMTTATKKFLKGRKGWQPGLFGSCSMMSPKADFKSCNLNDGTMVNVAHNLAKAASHEVGKFWSIIYRYLEGVRRSEVCEEEVVIIRCYSG